MATIVETKEIPCQETANIAQEDHLLIAKAEVVRELSNVHYRDHTS